MKTWTVIELLRAATDHLQKKGISGGRLDSELLLGFVIQKDRLGLYVGAENLVSDDDRGRFRELIQRRIRGEPVAYMLGWREFYGHRISVDRRVLIPRPESEHLVDEALRSLPPSRNDGQRYGALDLCTGSGCIAIALAKARSDLDVLATDISEEALQVSRANVQDLGVVAQVQLAASDLMSAIDPSRRFDLVTANPPYVTEVEWKEAASDVRDYEPKLALVAATDPWDFHERILRALKDRLKPKAAVAMEISDQASVPMERLEAAFPYQGDFRVIVDYAGLQRVLAVRRR